MTLAQREGGSSGFKKEAWFLEGVIHLSLIWRPRTVCYTDSFLPLAW